MDFVRKKTRSFFICTKIVSIVYPAIGIIRQNFHHILCKNVGEDFENNNLYFIKGDDYAYWGT